MPRDSRKKTNILFIVRPLMVITRHMISSELERQYACAINWLLIFILVDKCSSVYVVFIRSLALTSDVTLVISLALLTSHLFRD